MRLIREERTHRPARPSTRRAADSLLWVVAMWIVVTSGMLIVGNTITVLIDGGSVVGFDERASEWLASHRTKRLNWFTSGATYLANTEGIVVVAVAFVATTLMRKRGAYGAVALIGLAFELSAFLVTTFIVGRDRPDVERLNSTPSTYSFPSGHTAATVVLYGALVLYVMSTTARAWVRAAGWVGVVLVACVVGFARVYRGMHFVTDVAGGAMLGALALFVAWHTMAFLRESPRRSYECVSTHERVSATEADTRTATLRS